MSRQLRLGYKRKIHPVVYANDDFSEPACLPLPTETVSDPPLAPLPDNPCPMVSTGLAMMNQFLSSSLSPGTVTEYQVCLLILTGREKTSNERGWEKFQLETYE